MQRITITINNKNKLSVCESRSWCKWNLRLRFPSEILSKTIYLFVSIPHRCSATFFATFPFISFRPQKNVLSREGILPTFPYLIFDLIISPPSRMTDFPNLDSDWMPKLTLFIDKYLSILAMHPIDLALGGCQLTRTQNSISEECERLYIVCMPFDWWPHHCHRQCQFSMLTSV